MLGSDDYISVRDGRAPFGSALNDYDIVKVLRCLRRQCAMGLEGYRVEAVELALPVGPLAALAQGEEPGTPRGARGLGQEGVDAV